MRHAFLAAATVALGVILAAVTAGDHDASSPTGAHPDLL